MVGVVVVDAAGVASGRYPLPFSVSSEKPGDRMGVGVEGSSEVGVEGPLAVGVVGSSEDGAGGLHWASERCLEMALQSSMLPRPLIFLAEKAVALEAGVAAVEAPVSLPSCYHPGYLSVPCSPPPNQRPHFLGFPCFVHLPPPLSVGLEAGEGVALAATASAVASVACVHIPAL